MNCRYMLSDLRFSINLPPHHFSSNIISPTHNCSAAEMILVFVSAASFCLVSHSCNYPYTEDSAMAWLLPYFLKAQLFKSCARANPSSCLHVSIYVTYRLALLVSVSKAEIYFLLLIKGTAVSWDHLSYWNREPQEFSQLHD